jgi:ComF family protein
VGISPPERAGPARTGRLRDIVRGALQPLRDFVYPPLCLACDARLTGDEEMVCTRCWNGIPRAREEHPVWKELRARFEAEGVIGDFLSCYLFEKVGALREIFHRMKYGGMKSLADPLGRDLGRLMQGDPRFAVPCSLVPVPLHRVKRRERGYNQSELIARAVSRATGIPLDSSLIVRRRYTETQTELDRDRRRENVRGAFALDPDLRRSVGGRTFVLVDDIVTTGSTLNACAR